MKHLKHLVLALAACILSLAPAAHASGSEEAAQSELLAQVPFAPMPKLQLGDTGGPFAAAPPLSYLQAYAVISSQYPQYEYLAENQYTTVQDHGGAEMYVVTVELGYGATRFAKINGGANLVELQRQNIVDPYTNLIIGWYIWWTANGYQGGNFTYQNTSQNSPWNTMYDSVTIL